MQAGVTDMIPDEEMRELFDTECSGHLLRVNDGLLSLENNPSDRSALEAVFREIHGLKGAARMLGLTDIEFISRAMEEIFGAARNGIVTLNGESVQVLRTALEAVRCLAGEAVSGDPADVSPHFILHSLKYVMSDNNVSNNFSGAD
jgi:two-component system, chemotaxis family, sensor kinase CheA